MLELGYMHMTADRLTQILELLKSEGFIETKLLDAAHHDSDCIVVIQDERYRIEAPKGNRIFPAIYIWMKPRVSTPEVRLGWYNLDRDVPIILGNHITRIRLIRKFQTNSLRLSFNHQLEGLRLDLGTLDEQYRALQNLKKKKLLDFLLNLSEIAAKIKHPTKREDHLVDAWHMVNETAQ